MKTLTLFIVALFFSCIGLFAQSGLTIKSGGAVTVHGNTIITPPFVICGTPFTDIRNGNSYNTVQIGTQCLMAQNLNIGTKINGSGNQTNNGILEKYCYNDDENYCTIYGALYQWDEAMQYSTTSGVQGICPSGWHLPTDAEWTALTTYLGGENIAGGKLKEAGTSHWYSQNGTNSSGFTALPGGYRNLNGSFYYIRYTGSWWTSDKDVTGTAWSRDMYDYDATVDRYNDLKNNGFSIRCWRN
jgi:uncharacterized protein (TIGR02145 family)